MKLKRSTVGVILIIFIIVSAIIVASEIHFSGRFYPHSIIGGEDVSGKTFDEVFKKLDMAATRIEHEGFVVRIASSTIKIPSFSQGLTPDTVVEYFSIGDWKGVLQKAYDLGRQGNILRRMSERLGLLFSPMEVTLPYTLQESALNSLLTREIGAVVARRQEAYIKAVGATIEIVPEVNGQSINQEAIISQLRSNLETLDTSPSFKIFATTDRAVITAKKLELIVDFARSLASRSYAILKFDGFSSYVSGPMLASWLTLNDKEGVSLTLNQKKLEEYVRAKVDPYVDSAPQNSRFEMQGDSLVEIVAGTSGQTVDLSSLNQQLVGALLKMYLTSAFGGKSFDAINPIILTVNLIPEDPKITEKTIAEYGIKDLVGTVTTNFKGSTADRAHNIKAGLDHINGLLIAPGQEFSTVRAIGEVTEEEGYVKEYVIKGNESIKELGGGLCQISTTLFRLALNAGLPITERVNHKYVVGYYGPGLDATIYGPHPDLKFVNDTKGYLLLQGRIEGGNSLVLEFYGQKDDRKAEVTVPVITNRIPPPDAKFIPTLDLRLGVQKCTEHARYGQTTDATSTVTYADGRQRVQQFHSVYTPWAQVCLVGVSLTAPLTQSSDEGVH